MNNILDFMRKTQCDLRNYMYAEIDRPKFAAPSAPWEIYMFLHRILLPIKVHLSDKMRNK